MTESIIVGNEQSAPPVSGRRHGWAALRGKLSFRNISAVYIGIALFAFFAIVVPKSFLQLSMWRALLDSTSVTAIVALGLLVPTAAGAFDLSVGAIVGFGAILAAWFVASTGLPIAAVLVLSLAAAAAIGLCSGLLVTRWRIDSFIATLGMSSITLALISWVSGDQQILGLSSSFQALGSTEILGLTSSVWAAVSVALVLWYIVEQTEWGRRLIATGSNTEAARLAGVPTSRFIVQALVIGGLVAGFAGILTSSKLGTGDPTLGPPYLLPAFTAVFLGSTQFRNGRFNVWGTVLATVVLAVGVKGFQLMGAPVWLPDLFNGVALLLAVGLAKLQTRGKVAAAPTGTPASS